MITPNGMIKLCSTPLALDQTNQIRFASRNDQAAYFAGQAVFAIDNITFTRQDQSIKVPYHIDRLWNINYVMYNNSNFGGRWFYAFVTGMEWLSENSTRLTIKTDVYQTWMLNCEFKPSFVEREHVADDSIGLHTIDEGIETGEFIRSTNIVDADLGALDIIIASTLQADAVSVIFGDIYSGIYSGVKYYGSSNPAAIGRFIDAFNDAGKIEAIMAIFMCPHKISGATFATDVVEISPAALATFFTITAPARPETVNGLIPKNNKLFCYPYHFLYVHNNSGNSAVYRYEFFDGTPEFSLFGSISPNPVYKIIPHNILGYPATGNDSDSGLTIGGYPLCPWASDAYKNWIAQNGGSIAASTAAAVLAIGIGVASAGIGAPAATALTAKTMASIAAISSGANLVLQQIGNQSEKRAQPPQAQGQVNSGSANVSVGWNDFFLYGKSILAEYAQIIDDYFSMYGYKVNSVKVPELNSRPVWNYVKTIDANIIGNVPADDLLELRGIFNKGVTLWSSGTIVGDYSQDNAIAGV